MIAVIGLLLLLGNREFHCRVLYFLVLLVIALRYTLFGLFGRPFISLHYLNEVAKQIAMIVCTLECLVLCYGYGYAKFEKDLMEKHLVVRTYEIF